ncbi:MAG TPA: hypothetical protein VHW09_24150 [Bryobacteraceae bacterium]|jgi:hypothetical protein|nr:hypothetical protein [Bryobacteraceae bacterium]
MITDEELNLIDARCLATTPGPWKSWVEGRDHESGDHFIGTAGEDIYLTGVTLADQDFIAAARQDVPVLIAAIRELKSHA